MSGKRARANRKQLERGARKYARESFNAYLQVASNLGRYQRMKFAFGVLFRQWTNETRRGRLWVTRAWALLWLAAACALLISGYNTSVAAYTYEAPAPIEVVPSLHAADQGVG